MNAVVGHYRYVAKLLGLAPLRVIIRGGSRSGKPERRGQPLVFAREEAVRGPRFAVTLDRRLLGDEFFDGFPDNEGELTTELVRVAQKWIAPEAVAVLVRQTMAFAECPGC